MLDHGEESVVTQWEHAVLCLDAIDGQEIFRKIGLKGWELVTVNNNKAYFKRLVQPTKTQEVSANA